LTLVHGNIPTLSSGNIAGILGIKMILASSPFGHLVASGYLKPFGHGLMRLYLGHIYKNYLLEINKKQVIT